LQLFYLEAVTLDILFLLIPITLVFMGLAFWGFIWSVKKGQYDDLDSPAHKILFDDDLDRMPEAKSKQASDTEE